MREEVHGRCHLDQRRGEPAAEQIGRSRHHHDGEANRPEDVSLHRGQFGLDRCEPFVGGVSNRNQDWPRAIIDLRKVGRLLDQRALARHIRQKTRLIDIDELADFGFAFGGDISLREFDRELISALAQLIAIFLVAAQHEILLMATHHQHENGQSRLIVFF